MKKSNQFLFFFLSILMMTNCTVKTSKKTETSTSAKKPNIIYIMLDEWGYYEFSKMGHPIFETPNIDKLADEGMQFRQFLAGANVCAPTRGVLMTGQHTGHCAIRSNGGQILRADDITIANILKKAGYKTGGFGKWGCGDVGTTGVPEKHGFDIFYGYYNQKHAHSFYPQYLIRNSKKEYLKGNTGDYHSGETFSQELIHKEALNFIRKNKDKPFFAYLPYTPPHGQWMLPENLPEWQKYKYKQWDAGMQKKETDARMYAAMVEYMDRQIGEIRALLKELNIDDNTIIFLSGDNGGAPYFHTAEHPYGFFAPNMNPKTGQVFRGGKGNFYEGGLRIPFIVNWPGKIKAGSVSDYLGYFPDIMPTCADLAGVEAPKTCDGISILPTLTGNNNAQKQHKYLYWEDPRRKNSAVRMGDWKAVDPRENDNWELYNLKDDIEEKHNIADKYPEMLEKLQSFANEAHSEQIQGEVLDANAGFNEHE